VFFSGRLASQYDPERRYAALGRFQPSDPGCASWTRGHAPDVSGLFVFVDGQGGIGRAADDLRGRQRERPASVLWAIGSLTNKDSK
jgi:hypothetical protein